MTKTPISIIIGSPSLFHERFTEGTEEEGIGGEGNEGNLEEVLIS